MEGEGWVGIFCGVVMVGGLVGVFILVVVWRGVNVVSGMWYGGGGGV